MRGEDARRSRIRRTLLGISFGAILSAAGCFLSFEGISSPLTSDGSLVDGATDGEVQGDGSLDDAGSDTPTSSGGLRPVRPPNDVGEIVQISVVGSKLYWLLKSGVLHECSHKDGLLDLSSERTFLLPAGAAMTGTAFNAFVAVGSDLLRVPPAPSLTLQKVDTFPSAVIGAAESADELSVYSGNDRLTVLRKASTFQTNSAVVKGDAGTFPSGPYNRNVGFSRFLQRTKRYTYWAANNNNFGEINALDHSTRQIVVTTPVPFPSWGASHPSADLGIINGTGNFLLQRSYLFATHPNGRPMFLDAGTRKGLTTAAVVLPPDKLLWLEGTYDAKTGIYLRRCTIASCDQTAIELVSIPTAVWIGGPLLGTDGKYAFIADPNNIWSFGPF